jgi:uncharacterized membrane protein
VSTVAKRTRALFSRNWLTTSAIVFAALFAFAWRFVGVTEGLLVSFDLVALALLTTFVRMIVRGSPEDQPNYAVAQLRGTRFVLISSVVTSLVILAALSAELRPPNPVWEIGLSAVSLVLSWLFLNSVFALYYAHAFYGDGDRPPTGLQFPGTPAPSYSDFAYLSFVLGTTFQVPDVQITDSRIRRVALVHGVLSFFFNAIVIGLTVNTIATAG